MQDLRVTLIQTEQYWEDKAANLKHFGELLHAVSDTDLIILPEMFHTGFSMNAAVLAEDADDSAGIAWLKEQAYQKQAALYTSLIVRDEVGFKNRGVFVEPSGTVHVYDKVHLFSLAGEDRVFSPGLDRTIVTFRGWNIALQICYDLRFPELARNYVDSVDGFAYDCLLYVANWPERRVLHWETLLPARAIENQAYAVGVNRVGVDGKNNTYSGSSMAIDALGNIVARFDPGVSAWQTVVLRSESLRETREQLAFLKDRKDR